MTHDAVVISVNTVTVVWWEFIHAMTNRNLATVILILSGHVNLALFTVGTVGGENLAELSFTVVVDIIWEPCEVVVFIGFGRIVARLAVCHDGQDCQESHH